MYTIEITIRTELTFETAEDARTAFSDVQYIREEVAGIAASGSYEIEAELKAS